MKKNVVRAVYYAGVSVAVLIGTLLFLFPFRYHILAAVLWIVLFVLIHFAIALGLYDFALNRKHVLPFGWNIKEDPEDPETVWTLAHTTEQWMQSRDGLMLHARLISNPGHRYALLCHGYRCNGLMMGLIAHRFSDRGFSVLLPDARGHGQSEGRYIGMGWNERRDIVDWCERIIRDDSEAVICLYGISMGAATVMMTSGEEELDSRVRWIIEDCGYTSVWDEMVHQIRDMFGLPSFPLIPRSDLITFIRDKYGFREASCVRQLKKNTRPILMIHGEKDTFVPYWMLERVYDAVAGEKEKLSVPGASHGTSCTHAPETYWNAVDAFLKKHAGRS